MIANGLKSTLGKRHLNSYIFETYCWYKAQIFPQRDWDVVYSVAYLSDRGLGTQISLSQIPYWPQMMAWTFVVSKQKKFRNAGIYQTHFCSPKGEKHWLFFYKVWRQSIGRAQLIYCQFLLTLFFRDIQSSRFLLLLPPQTPHPAISVCKVLSNVDPGTHDSLLLWYAVLIVQ